VAGPSSARRATWAPGTPPADVLAGVAAALGAPWDGPGRPAPVTVPAGVPGWQVLDATREALAAPDLRAHHTPEGVARRLAALALDGVGPAAVVADPSCGGGAFLLAAAEHLAAGDPGADRRRIVRDQLAGADLDPLAVATTRAALALWSGGEGAPQVVVADGLSSWRPPASVDAVVGNPPFRSPLAAGARPGRLGAYTDLAGRFLAAALPLVRGGGTLVLLQPESFLAARDAAPVRAAVVAGGALAGLWVAGEDVFDGAAVRVCAPLVRVGGRQGPVRRWSGPGVRPAGTAGLDPEAPTWSHLRPDAPPPPRPSRRTVGDLATATAGFREEFYALAAAATDGGDGSPLVTSGLIDPGTLRWGTRPARIGGRRFQRPTVDVDALDGRIRSWAAARQVPKVLVATQTRVLEAAPDPGGRTVPLTPVVAVVPRDPADVWRVAAALTAPAATAWALRHYGGTGLGRASVRLSASQLLAVPLPTDADAWDAAAAALAAGDVDACAALLATGAELDWWRARRPAPAEGV